MASLPDDPFDHYVSLGADRSYQAVADAYAVTKRTIARRAKRERWQERLAAIESSAREESHARHVETFAQISERHVKMLRAIQSKALAALQTAPMATGAQAARALEAAIKAERAILKPRHEDSTVIDVLAEVTRRAGTTRLIE